MDPEKIIRGKKVLIVDDEKDVLDSLVALLDVCKIDTALSFDEGKRLLDQNDYHIAILDIMGVEGFKLLELARKKHIPVMMFTAHGLSEENLLRSAKNGASYYAPKENMTDIAAFVADVLDATERKMNPWAKWFERLSNYYDRRFGGKDWREKETRFWQKRIKELPYE